MTDKTELKRLADVATQGEWTHLKHGVIKGGPAVKFANGSTQCQIAMTVGAEWMREGEQGANADFIAAANPAAIKALIEELEWSQLMNAEEIDRVEISQGLQLKARNSRDRFKAERDQLKAQVERLKAENQSEVGACLLSVAENKKLQAENEALRGLYQMHKATETREMRCLKTENEALRKDAERYRGVRRVANRQGFTDEQFDQQTDTRTAKFDAAMGKGGQP